MTGSVVVGIDGSDASRTALYWAVDEAERRQTRLWAVHAWEAPVSWGFGTAMVPLSLDEAQETAQEEAEGWVAAAGAARGEFTVPLEVSVRRGHPGAVLIEAATADDLLVVGTRGRGGFADLLLGSCSVYCVHHARSTVVVVR